MIDEGNREALRIECVTAIPSSRVLRVMGQLVEVYGKPEAIRVDNGPELTAGAFEVLDAWLFNAASEVQAADDWRTDYNEYRPHDS